MLEHKTDGNLYGSWACFDDFGNWSSAETIVTMNECETNGETRPHQLVDDWFWFLGMIDDSCNCCFYRTLEKVPLTLKRRSRRGRTP